jgi:hypothetical protein
MSDLRAVRLRLSVGPGKEVELDNQFLDPICAQMRLEHHNQQGLVGQ